MQTSFTYDGSGTGELNAVTTPYGGQLQWTYLSYTMAARSQREMQYRYLKKASGATPTLYQLFRASDGGQTFHIYADMVDYSGNGEKVWAFETSNTPAQAGLQTMYEARNLSPRFGISHQDNTWALDGASNPYISAVVMTLDQANLLRLDRLQRQRGESVVVPDRQYSGRGWAADRL